MSNHWPRVELDQVVEDDRRITYGVVKPGDHVEDGIKLVRGGDVVQGRIATNTLRTISPQLSETYKRTVLRGGELLISLVGNPGEVAIVPPALEGANIARQVGLIALRPDVEARFVMYFLMSPEGRAEIFARTGGAVQQVINLAELKSVKIPTPPLAQQRQIASVLSAYDDLIENNRRRMALLEEAARLVFHEWFVRLRFPGHEHTPINNGVPEGWSRTTMQEHISEGRVSLQTGPFGTELRASDYTETGTPVINVRNIGYGDLRPDKLERVPDAIIARLPQHVLAIGDIVFGRKGAVDRHLFIDPYQAGWMQGSDCIRLRALSDRVSTKYLSFLFREEEHKQWMLTHCSNKATMASLNHDVIGRIELLSPPQRLLREFDDFSSDVLTQIGRLQRQAQKATEARDLLLPRLMSGELAV